MSQFELRTEARDVLEGEYKAACKSLTPDEMERICETAHQWTVEHCKESEIKVWADGSWGKDLHYTEAAQYVFNMYHDQAERQFVEGII